MPKLGLSSKVLVTASLVSLLAYTAWILRGSITIVIGYFNHVPSDVYYIAFTGPVFWVGGIGLAARLTGTILGLTTIYLLWIKGKPFLYVKKLVAAALILEGVNFLALIPSVWFLKSFSASLEYGYLLQILFTTPFLWILAIKVLQYKEPLQKHNLLKFGAITFVAYAVALCANEVSRWTSMISADTPKFITGIRAVGFYNAVAFMPFAIVFAVVGAFCVFRQKEKWLMRWMGASLAVIGLNYTIYLYYSYVVNTLNTLPLVDVWTIPLLGLGIALMLNSFKPATASL